MKLYTASVYGQIGEQGVFVNLRSANAVDVEGRLYADSVGDGTFLVAATDGWHETEQAAREEAATKVAAMAATLTTQAERIRNGGQP